MRVTIDLCMPEGEVMRQQFGRLMNELKLDNRLVIAAMLREGMEVPDTVGDLDLDYVPEIHRVDADDEPIMHLFGMRKMIERGTFSCGDAASYEAAVLEEKYSIPANCLAVATGEDDMHGIIVTADRTIDPTANFLAGRSEALGISPNPTPQACTIQEGRVVCHHEPQCYVDTSGNWHCPAVPGLDGRRERIGRIFGAGRTRWATIAGGGIVPVYGGSTRRRMQRYR